MHHRSDRVAALIHEELARLLREEVSDPRLAAVSVTRVRVTADLRVARVRVLPLGGEGDRRELMAGLRRASSYLRRMLARQLHLRYTPELLFSLDEAFEEAVRLTTLLGRLEREERLAGGEE